MSNVTTVGIDLAKNVFAVHGVDALGRVVLRRTVRRERLLELVAQLPVCLIGIGCRAGPWPCARGADITAPVWRSPPRTLASSGCCSRGARRCASPETHTTQSHCEKVIEATGQTGARRT